MFESLSKLFSYLWLIVFISSVLMVVVRYLRDHNQGQRRQGGGGGVHHFSDLLSDMLIIPWVIDRCRSCNPLLSWSQEQQLRQMLRGVVQSWNRGVPVLPLLRPIVALAVPNGDLAIDLIQSFATQWHQPQISIQQHFNSPQHSPLRNSLALVSSISKEFGIAEDRLKSLPDHPTLEELLKTLRSGPTCPITLEDLVLPTKKLDKNVAALVQRNDSTSTSTRNVFLYRLDALQRWLNDGTHTNPLNRNPVNPHRDLFTLS